MSVLDPARVQALAERLIALPSVSPDVVAETRCAAAIQAALPRGVTNGVWPTADGRPVVWALLEGGSTRTVVVLAHYDTVGVEDFERLDPSGAALAFDPRGLRERWLALDPTRLPDAVRRDLDQERRAPGTWLFGRGALDMKSGLADGLAALEALAQDRSRLPGSVLFLACPDEENQSAGMLRAVPELAALAQRLDLRGALNLDFVERPVAYQGVVGKCLVGFYVLGQPTHVGSPFGGVDAAQWAAAIVDRITTSPTLTAEIGGGRPPVVLRLRDAKPRYDVQTALEAEVEVNFALFDAPLSRLSAALRAEVRAAVADVTARMRRLAKNAPELAASDTEVLTYPELAARVTGAESAPTTADPRAASWQRIRAAARAASLMGPAVVIALLPPYYPPSPPRGDRLGARLAPWLASQGVPMEPFYRHISDASYLAWRGAPSNELRAWLPAWEHEYRLPVENCAALDLEVVTLGPWGRDAHGPFERVERRFAFEVLPARVAKAAIEAVRE